MTAIRDQKADGTREGDVQYGINLPLKVTTQQKTAYGDSNTLKKGQGTSPAPKEENDFKISREESDQSTRKEMTDIYFHLEKMTKLLMETAVLILINTRTYIIPVLETSKTSCVPPGTVDPRL